MCKEPRRYTVEAERGAPERLKARWDFFFLWKLCHCVYRMSADVGQKFKYDPRQDWSSDDDNLVVSIEMMNGIVLNGLLMANYQAISYGPCPWLIISQHSSKAPTLAQLSHPNNKHLHRRRNKCQTEGKGCWMGRRNSSVNALEQDDRMRPDLSKSKGGWGKMSRCSMLKVRGREEVRIYDNYQTSMYLPESSAV